MPPTAPLSEAIPAPLGPPARATRRLAPMLRAVLFPLIKAVLALALLGVLSVAGLIGWYARDLPRFDGLNDYQPKQVTRVHCADGSVCGEFFEERRTWLKKEQLPDRVKQAFISAEDAHFYEHGGVDYVAIVRAVVKNALHIGIRSGASTITQQVVKTFILGPERTLARKVREWVLAKRLEENLSKEEILELYVNQIYFGHQRYGVQEAARFYFGVDVTELTVGQAAMLGGIPQSPNRINPVTDMKAAKNRQTYVLRQMAKNGFITAEVAEAEIQKPIALAPPEAEPLGGYYLEEVRRSLEAKYGTDALLHGGLHVQIAMDPSRQRAAERAMDEGLRALDKRQGWRGPLAQLTHAGRPPTPVEQPAKPAPTHEEEDDSPEGAEKPEPAAAPVAPLAKSAEEVIAALHTALDPKLARGSVRSPGAWVGWDLGPATQAIADEGTAAVIRASRFRVLTRGIRLTGVVAALDSPAKGKALIDLGTAKALLSIDETKWARPWSPGKATAKPTTWQPVLQVGDLVEVELGELPQDRKQPLPAKLEQAPKVQGALVSIDPLTRDVVALVGGSDFALSSFDRATQAHRQPGSSFKPFVWAAALATQRYTPATLVNDAPMLVRDPSTGREWKPVNFERDVFDGPLSLRTALAESKNTIAVRLAEELGPEALIDMARRAGIASPIPSNLTIALGTAEVTPLEHANAYATLAAGGRRAEPRLLLQVTDAAGKQLERAEPAAFEETIPATVAFLTSSVMESVVQEGTAVRAKQLQRPLAGKTGTAQDHRDAWFCGYSPDLVTAVWVGFDDHDPLGGAETGAHAALPIWMGFMRSALEGKPPLEFTPPPGITQARVDPRSGKRMPDDVGGRLEWFIEGTVPEAIAPTNGQVAPDDFFLEGSGKR